MKISLPYSNNASNSVLVCINNKIYNTFKMHLMCSVLVNKFDRKLRLLCWHLLSYTFILKYLSNSINSSYKIRFFSYSFLRSTHYMVFWDINHCENCVKLVSNTLLQHHLLNDQDFYPKLGLQLHTKICCFN